MKIGVVGAGKWGSALKDALSLKSSVCIWSKTPRDGQVSIDEVLTSEYLLVAIASQHIDEWFKQNYIFKNTQKLLIASKGIDKQNGLFLNHILSKYAPEENTIFLSGPSFASEVAKKLPTALVLSCKSEQNAKEWSTLFPTFIKTYISDDVIGAEVGGAYKNVIAIAAGICEGLQLGQNARAALITRGLAEMTRFGLSFGANIQSFLGLGGVGDLLLTATSQTSRNYRVGLALSHGKTLQEALIEIKETAEGVDTAFAIDKICGEKNLYAPIAKEVTLILNGKNPKESISALLSSSNKNEFY
ncbi:MAG: hypothetical protein RL154_1655 [Pseudomonadota bacterium]|jgi:glycerol-3-phosphate dehydrogenase (NAD(P)+)